MLSARERPLVSGRSEVVSVIRHEVRPDSDAAYEAWIREVVPIAQTFPGHQGVVVIRPGDGSRTYTAVLHFDTREHLGDWLESDARRQLLARIEPALLHPGEVEIKPGLDFWIPSPGLRRARPARQFLVALSVIFPLSIIVPLALRPLFALAPAIDVVLVRAFASAAVIVWLMTYVIMPRYTRLVGRWLFEGVRNETGG